MSQMIEVKTAELKGDLLDCLVATIENPEEKIFHNSGGYTLRWHNKPPKFSTDWAKGGPLIAKYGNSIGMELRISENSASFLQSGMRVGYTASTVLIAACRAIVAAKLGDTVAVPAELLP